MGGGHRATAGKRWWRLATVLAAAAVPAAGMVAGGPSAAAAGGQLRTVSLEVPAANSAFAPFYLGIKKGVFRRYGIDLRLVTEGAPAAVQRIVGGTLDFMATVGTAGAAGIEGRGLRVYDVTSDETTFVMLAAPGVTTMSQLAGRTVAGGSASGLAGQMASLMLQHAAVPASSVRMIAPAPGGTGSRIALLQSGQAAACPVDVTRAFALVHQGYHVIADTRFVHEPFTGLATSRSFARAHPSLVRAMVEATVAATAMVKSDEKAVVHLLQGKPFTLSPSVAAQVWAYERPGWTAGGQPTRTAIQNQLTGWQIQLKLKAAPPQGKAFDFRYLGT